MTLGRLVRCLLLVTRIQHDFFSLDSISVRTIGTHFSTSPHTAVVEVQKIGRHPTNVRVISKISQRHICDSESNLFGLDRLGLDGNGEKNDDTTKSTMASETSPDDDSARVQAQKIKVEMLADEDPLLISQSLTYVTDDGSTLHSFASAPFSTS
jgi:hypothetical protein